LSLDPRTLFQRGCATLCCVSTAEGTINHADCNIASQLEKVISDRSKIAACAFPEAGQVEWSTTWGDRGTEPRPLLERANLHSGCAGLEHCGNQYLDPNTAAARPSTPCKALKVGGGFGFGASRPPSDRQMSNVPLRVRSGLLTKSLRQRSRSGEAGLDAEHVAPKVAKTGPGACEELKRYGSWPIHVTCI
jgi:hypothetical protein